MTANKIIVSGWLAAACAVGCIGDAADDEQVGVATDAITPANFAFDALQFTGSSYAQANTVLSAAVDNITLEAWIRRDGGPGGIVAYNGNSSSSGFGLYAASNGAVKVLVGGEGWVECDGCNLPIGVWTHIAVQRIGAWQFFQNGQRLRATSATATLAMNPPAGQFSIGAAPMGANPFTGAIDEVRFWNVAVPSRDIDTRFEVALDGADPHLVGYYRLDDGDGDTAIDASLSRRPLALHDDPIWISSGATLSTGISHDALQFLGTAYGRTATVVTQRTDGFTLEGWVRWDGGSRPSSLLYNGSSTSNGYGFYVLNGAVSLLAGGVSSTGCGGCRLVAGVWSHLAATRSAGVWRIYQDGVERAATPSLDPAVPRDAFSIAGNALGGERLIGAIDEVRIWGVARTAAQIAAGYTVSLVGTEPDLLAYYRMDDGSGAIAADSAGNHPITLIDAPLWVTSGALLATAQR